MVPLILLCCALVAFVARRRYKLSQLDDSWLARLNELKVVDPNKRLDETRTPNDLAAGAEEKADGKFSMGGNSLSMSWFIIKFYYWLITLPLPVKTLLF